MRILVVLAAGATVLVGGCVATPKPPAQAAAAVQQDWVLIAPPDNHQTAAFLETFEFLPDHQDRFPRTTNGMTEQQRRSLQELFEQVAAEPSPEARVRILTESSAMTAAPVEQWREVRVFRSAAACESTRAELVKVTSDQTEKFGAYDGMPREEFQWPMLARSFASSRCVPDEVAAKVGSG
jgi:hypothetical protein